jgi:CMP-N-acetylneuraminic acid synthetase
MYKGKKIIAVIPARGRNDGIPHMNMRELGGKPLIYHTIAAAKACDFIDKLIVSTEDENIAGYSRSQGAEVPFLRSGELAGQDVVMDSIIDEVLAYYESIGEKYDILLNLYPNAPFKKKDSLLKFVVKAFDFDMVIPLYPHQNYFWNVDGGKAKLAIDTKRTTRRKTIKKHEELGGIYSYKLKDGKRNILPESNTGFCELDFHDSRMVKSVYDLIMLDRLARLPDTLLKDLFNEE